MWAIRLVLQWDGTPPRSRDLFADALQALDESGFTTSDTCLCVVRTSETPPYHLGQRSQAIEGVPLSEARQSLSILESETAYVLNADSVATSLKNMGWHRPVVVDVTAADVQFDGVFNQQHRASDIRVFT